MEGLADRFEPRLCDAYAAIFSDAISRTIPDHSAGELLDRYRRVRRRRPVSGLAGQVSRVFVLSRVTLGADIAITSSVLDAAKRRFPRAEVVLAGGEKSRQLFAADARVRHLAVSYGRGGTLRERLSIWPQLQASLSEPGSIVIDPDSRLTQLGLLPVCPEENYFLFESRSYGGDGSETLTDLVRMWLAETLDVDNARPYIAPAEAIDPGPEPVIGISFGVGDNSAKRLPDPFEEHLLRLLGTSGAVLLVDKGAGGEEAERVERAIRRSGVPESRVRTWHGSFSAFAAMLARSRLYVGYDSAGQHAAAACGVPLISIFAGFPSSRMFERWRPTGPGLIEVVRVDRPDPVGTLAEVSRVLSRLGVL